MVTLVLIAAVVLLVAAIRSHALAQANVKTKVDREWFERLFTGNRAPVDTLTELGLRYRKKSNQYTVGGFLMIGLYVLLKFST